VTDDPPTVTLVDALEKPLRSPHTKQCLFARVRDSLSQEEVEALDRALDKVRTDKNNGHRKVYSTAWLSSVLTSQGYPISSATIQRHLRNICGCRLEDDNE
jgi:hypothetical protein